VEAIQSAMLVFARVHLDTLEIRTQDVAMNVLQMANAHLLNLVKEEDVWTHAPELVVLEPDVPLTITYLHARALLKHLEILSHIVQK
jgi:hypothetical protein